MDYKSPRQRHSIRKAANATQIQSGALRCYTWSSTPAVLFPRLLPNVLMLGFWWPSSPLGAPRNC